jgi:hypothetical protein
LKSRSTARSLNLDVRNGYVSGAIFDDEPTTLLFCKAYEPTLMCRYYAKSPSVMKVSLQQLLAFRVATDQATRSRLVGVVNGPSQVQVERGIKACETGPALTFKASSNLFLAEGFFITPGPLAGEYHLRPMRHGGVDLREIEIPRHLISQLIQRLLQENKESPHETVARLVAMPTWGNESARAPAHVAGYVTFYNSEHDYTNIYAVLYKPGDYEVEVALYRTPPESVTPGTPRSELLPTFPFFRQRTDITPLLEAAAQRAMPHYTGQMSGGADDSELDGRGAFYYHYWPRQLVAAAILGVAGVLAVIWCVVRA